MDYILFVFNIYDVLSVFIHTGIKNKFTICHVI
jgi:hypothetical protein